MEIDEEVRALAAATSKVQLQSEVTLHDNAIPVGNVGTMEVLLGKQEMQRLLTEREIVKATSRNTRMAFV